MSQTFCGCLFFNTNIGSVHWQLHSKTTAFSFFAFQAYSAAKHPDYLFHNT